jgi:hypothetical protein
MRDQLGKAANDLSELVSIFPPVHLGDLLDLTAGALAGLIRAQELEYQDRVGEELPPEYYGKLSERIAKMANGTLPPHGRWISGYYFNSALLRLGAAREMTKRLLDSLDKRNPRKGSNLKPIGLDTIYAEYCSLKHNLRSLRLGRNITLQQVVGGLVELVDVLSKRRDELSDPNTKFPAWEHKRRQRKTRKR